MTLAKSGPRDRVQKQYSFTIQCAAAAFSQRTLWTTTFMNHFTRKLASIIFLGLVFSGLAKADHATATRLTLEAKEALDAHYGKQERLAEAASLLKRAIAENPDDAAAYVQVARLTIKGGHVVSTRFRPGTLDAYGELLDRALSLDPRNAKAHILKAEYFHFKGDRASEQAELDKAKATGTKDLWLLVGYGRLYRNLGDLGRSSASYAEARSLGPGASLEQRNAHVAALGGLAELAVVARNENALTELIGATQKARDPRDAWSLGELATLLVRAGMFEEAIPVAREALQVMNYGAGRLTLAAALFGRAAELTLAGKKELADPLVREARALGYGESEVFRRFNPMLPKVARLLPTIGQYFE